MNQLSKICCHHEPEQFYVCSEHTYLCRRARLVQGREANETRQARMPPAFQSNENCPPPPIRLWMRLVFKSLTFLEYAYALLAVAI